MKDNHPTPPPERGGDPVAMFCLILMVCVGAGFVLIPVQRPSRMDNFSYHFACFAAITFVVFLVPLAFGRSKKDQ